MMSLRTVILLLLVVGAASLVGYVGYLQKELKVAEAKATAAEARVVAHEKAAAALNAHLLQVQAEREAWEAIATELEKEEGVANTLSPYLRGVLNSVR